MSNQMNSQWQAGDILLEQYKVIGILGQDGLGEVYKANHLGWRTDLAIRSLKPEVVAALGGVEALSAAVESWINLGLHPHIASCYYLRKVENTFLLFTEYVSGGSLRDWISDRRLYLSGADRRILDIAIQLAWALHYISKQSVTHQNVGPETVQITSKGAAKLTDLSLDRGQTLIAQPNAANSMRSDIWGWGTTVLEMYVGKRVEPHVAPAPQMLETYLATGPSDPQLPRMPQPIAALLRHCFQANLQHTVNLQQVARELQTLYHAVTGCVYPRQEPTPQPVATLNNRALCLWDLGQVEQAFALWDQGLTTQPQHPESIYNRGLLRWRAGMIDDCALLEQLRSCHIEPQAKRVDYLLSLAHLERGDSQTALNLLNLLEIPATQPEELEEIKAALTLARTHQSTRQFLRQLGETSPDPEITPRRIAVALSSDGRYALSGEADQLKLWQVETGKCLYVFKGHQKRVTAVAFSPDGYYILSGSEDKTLKLWNVTAANLVHTFDGLRERHLGYQSGVDKLVERISIATKKVLGGSKTSPAAGHQGAILSVDFSVDRKYILSGGEDKTVKLWSVQSGRCLRTFKGHRQPVFKVLFSPDRQQVLSASEDKTVKLWHLATGQLIHTLEGFEDLSSIAFIADGQQILTASSVLQRWDVSSGELLQTLTGQSAMGQAAGVTSIAANSDGDYFLSGSQDHHLRFWDAITGRCLRTFEGHQHSIEAVSFSADGRYGLSSDASSLRLWTVDATASTPLAPLQLSRSESIETISATDRSYEQALMLAQLAFQQGNFVTAAQQLRQARSLPGYSQNSEALQAWFTLYNYLPRQTLNNVWEQATFVRHTNAVCAVALSPDGRYALSGSADHTLKLWEVGTGRCLLSFEGHRNAINAVTFHPDGTYALSGSADKLLKIWNVQTGECVWTLEGHAESIGAVAFSPDGRYVLSGSADKTLKLWDTTAGYCLRTFDQHTESIGAVAFSPDGRYVLSGSADKTLKLWDITTGDCARTFEGHTTGICAVDFSTDNRYILSGADNALKLWQLNGECLKTLEGHKAAIRSMTLSADGNYALSGSDDNTLKLWNISNSECIRTLEGHKAAVRSVTLSADGRYALSGSDDNTLKLWTLDWDLVDKSAAVWDEGARPYLESFLILHTVAASVPMNLQTPEAVLSALKQSSATWTEADFNRLIRTLQQAGYGWLQPEGVRQQLTRMVQAATAKPVLKQPDSTVFATAFATEFSTAFGTSTASVTLSVTSGSLQGEEFIFREPTTCIIGRAKDCHLQLPNDAEHNTVSRYHCALDIDPPLIRIRDLGSLHGTYVNGQMIGRRSLSQNPSAAPVDLPDYPLSTGDEIQLGKTVLRVAIEGSQDEARTGFDEAALVDRTVFPVEGQPGEIMPESSVNHNHFREDAEA